MKSILFAVYFMGAIVFGLTFCENATRKDSFRFYVQLFLGAVIWPVIAAAHVGTEEGKRQRVQPPQRVKP